MNLPNIAARRINNVATQQTPASKQLVSIRNPEGNSPLFCIHPSGGDVGIYRKLATRLDPSRSVLGIQSQLECGATEELSSVEEMAHEYTRIIELQKPTGAIRLLGFSLGGFLASLIANNFHQSGRHVSFLGLIDSNPGWTVASNNSHQELCVRLTQVFTKFQNIGLMRKKPIETVQRDVAILVDTCFGNEQISSDKIMAKTTAMGYVPDRQADSKVLAKFTSTFLTHCRMLKNFQPPQINCPLYLWWPSETESENKTGSAIWSQRTKAAISESVVKGSHYSIMRGPAVRGLAVEVENAIGHAEAKLEKQANL